MESHQKFFQGYKQLPESFNILPEHIEDLQNRLDNIAVLSHQRYTKLQLEHSRYTLLNFLSNVEENLKRWNQKYGYEKEVADILQNYKVTLLYDLLNKYFVHMVNVGLINVLATQIY